MSTKVFTVAGAVAIALAAAAMVTLPAGTPKAQSAGDRYIVTPIDGGIMRVDRYTGEASVCRERSGQWRCELVPDERAGRRGRSGRDDLAGRGWRGRDDESFRGRRDEPYDDLGEGGVMSPDEVDKAMDTVEHMMKRFMETARKIQRDMRDETPPPR